MSLQETIDRAKALDLRTDPAQRDLTRDKVEPQLDRLLDRLREIRREIDVRNAPKIEVAKRSTTRATFGEVHWSRYPIGFCREIRNAAMPLIYGDSLFRNLIDHGVTVRPVFIFLRGCYFQNALQVGNYYMDVANDTVFPEKPQIDWAKIGELDYENLESWTRFATVAENYLKVAIYPNLLFPFAFPATPFFAVRYDGVIQLLLAQNQIVIKDLAEGMRRTLELVTDDHWMSRQLPGPFEQLIRDKFGANLFEAFPLEFKPVDRTVLQEQTVTEFVTLLEQPESVAYPVLKNYFELVERAANTFNRRGLRIEADELAALQTSGAVPKLEDLPGNWTVE